MGCAGHCLLFLLREPRRAYVRGNGAVQRIIRILCEKQPEHFPAARRPGFCFLSGRTNGAAGNPRRGVPVSGRCSRLYSGSRRKNGRRQSRRRAGRFFCCGLPCSRDQGFAAEKKPSLRRGTGNHRTDGQPGTAGSRRHTVKPEKQENGARVPVQPNSFAQRLMVSAICSRETCSSSAPSSIAAFGIPYTMLLASSCPSVRLPAS